MSNCPNVKLSFDGTLLISDQPIKVHLISSRKTKAPLNEVPFSGAFVLCLRQGDKAKNRYYAIAVKGGYILVCIDCSCFFLSKNQLLDHSSFDSVSKFSYKMYKCINFNYINRIL